VGRYLLFKRPPVTGRLFYCLRFVRDGDCEFMHPVLFHLGSLVIPSYGAVAALGVLLALGLAQWTAPKCRLDPRHAWNVMVLAVFAALALSRLVLIAMNLSDLRRHPQWLLAIAMVHHPLLAGIGIAGAAIAVLAYARWQRLSLVVVGDVLAAPACLGLAAEQFGALLAGSDYGREWIQADGRAGIWAVVYNDPLASRWSGAPLGTPVYPVQAYAAVGALMLAILLVLWMPLPRRRGDAAGAALIGLGALLFITELFRDWEGRGALMGGLVDIPQLVGLGVVVLGGVVLWEWRTSSRESQAVDERTVHERPGDVDI
jgi:phosphatidylglycerol:prolipoprotein diacylglycerol transferase